MAMNPTPDRIVVGAPPAPDQMRGPEGGKKPDRGLADRGSKLLPRPNHKPRFERHDVGRREHRHRSGAGVQREPGAEPDEMRIALDFGRRNGCQRETADMVNPPGFRRCLPVQQLRDSTPLAFILVHRQQRHEIVRRGELVQVDGRGGTGIGLRQPRSTAGVGQRRANQHHHGARQQREQLNPAATRHRVARWLDDRAGLRRSNDPHHSNSRAFNCEATRIPNSKFRIPNCDGSGLSSPSMRSICRLQYSRLSAARAKPTIGSNEATHRS